MLKIRMQRTGRANSPSFRIIVTEHARGPKTGNFVEKVGTYNPKTKERNLNTERIKHWLSVGAQASGTVHNMLISEKVVEGKKVNVLPKKSPPKKEDEESEKKEEGGEKAAEVAAPAAEAPSEESAPEAPKEEEVKKEETVEKAAPTPEGVGVPTPPTEDVGKEKPSDAEAVADKKE